MTCVVIACSTDYSYIFIAGARRATDDSNSLPM